MKTNAQIEKAVNPAHYKNHPSGVETIDIIKNMPFLLGTACKYLFRLGKKDDPLQELKKAEWYLVRWGEQHYKKHPKPINKISKEQKNFLDWCKKGSNPDYSNTDYAICSILLRLEWEEYHLVHLEALHIVRGMIADIDNNHENE